MRMREIIDLVEQVGQTDHDLFHTTHCDALAVKVHEIHHVPMVAIVDRSSGRYVRVCNRVADNYFITVDGMLDRDDMMSDSGIDPIDTAYYLFPISKADLEDFVRQNNVRPKSVEIMDRAENVAIRLKGW